MGHGALPASRPGSPGEGRLGGYEVGGVGGWGHQSLKWRKDVCLLNKDSRSWLPVAPERATWDQRGPQDWAGPEIHVLTSDPPNSGGILSPTEPHVLVCEVGGPLAGPRPGPWLGHPQSKFRERVPVSRAPPLER